MYKVVRQDLTRDFIFKGDAQVGAVDLMTMDFDIGEEGYYSLYWNVPDEPDPQNRVYPDGDICRFYGGGHELALHVERTKDRLITILPYDGKNYELTRRRRREWILRDKEEIVGSIRKSGFFLPTWVSDMSTEIPAHLGVFLIMSIRSAPSWPSMETARDPTESPEDHL